MAHANGTVRRIAYTDAVALQHAVNVAQHAALARDEPPPYLVDLVGLPDASSPDARLWDNVARGTEDLRLSGRFDPRQGIGDQAQDAPWPPQLRHDIDDLRERNGMEPLQAAAQLELEVESAGLDMG